MNKKLYIGKYGEDVAKQYLKDKGISILESNWRPKNGAVRGEVDIVGMSNNCLLVIEVKTRTSNIYGTPFESVTKNKYIKLQKLGACYLKEKQLELKNKDINDVRIDVVGINTNGNISKIEHLESAFY
jgi:putative endonuclease